MKRIIVPLPSKDFELTEVAVPWKLFCDEGYEVVFATEDGREAITDPLLIEGVIFGQLGAKPAAIRLYRQMQQQPNFKQPIRYDKIIAADYDALHLPGGHAKGMRQYLESVVLQKKVVDFFNLNKIVGAICHGPVLLSRSIDPQTGKSVLFNKRTTCLTKLLEGLGYGLTFWKLGDYYRTYPEYVQDEVCRCLKHKQQFDKGGLNIFKPFVCVDNNLVTARWPEDAYLYGRTVIDMLKHTDARIRAKAL